MDLPYSGFAGRAHFDSRPPVPGLNSEHLTGKTEPDIFNPQPDTPPNQGFDVWGPEESDAPYNNFPSLAAIPVDHWYDGQPSVPSNYPYGIAQQEMQERMMVDHSVENFVPDPARRFVKATQGHMIDGIVGMTSRDAGSSMAPGTEFLANGNNAFDQTNGVTEVYSGDSPNVGRYRLGWRWADFGLYDNPTGVFGQTAMVHAYTGQSAIVPVSKPLKNQISAPYAPYWVGADAYAAPASSWQNPSMFTQSADTSITDFTISQGAAADDNGFFDSGDFI